jgi:hypothetical protein
MCHICPPFCIINLPEVDVHISMLAYSPAAVINMDMPSSSYHQPSWSRRCHISMLAYSPAAVINMDMPSSYHQPSWSRCSYFHVSL